jgi:hypothetical protein
MVIVLQVGLVEVGLTSYTVLGGVGHFTEN